MGMDPLSTNYVNQLNRDDFDWDTELLRKAEAYLTSDHRKLWLGQAAWLLTGPPKSTFREPRCWLFADCRLAGGPFFRLDDGQLSTVHVKVAFTNFDGLGRKLRVRYDTPSFSGFSLATSVGTQVVPTEPMSMSGTSPALEKTFDEFKVSAALAYSEPGDDQNLYDGSVLVLHVPSGISLTLAAAYSDE